MLLKTLYAITPRSLHTYLDSALAHEGFKRYSKNTGWLLAARIVTFAVSFLTVAFVARYLGPENYGKLSYAQSFVAIFSIFASLGIDQILYRDLVAHPEKEDELLGTAFISKLVFGALTFVITVTVSLFLNTEPVLSLLIFLLCFTFLFQPLGILSSLFSARVQAKYPSYITIILAIVIPLLKLLIIWLNQGIIYFALLIVFESAVYSLYYLHIYLSRFHGKPRNWVFSRHTLLRLFRDSWPLLLAGLSGYIYGRIDQVMIQHFIDTSSVGLYDAAVKVTEMWAFLPGLVVGSLFPAIVNARMHDADMYARRLRSLTLFTLGLGTCIVLPIFLLAPLVIQILFGPDFLGAVPVLRIYIWTGIGTIGIVLIQNYLVAENKGKQYFVIAVMGAIANILLNVLLIPSFGMAGAAWATVVSYVLMVLGFLLPWCISRRKGHVSNLDSRTHTA